MLHLRSYNFQVVYRPGKTYIADALSRLNPLNPKDRSGEETDAVKMIAEESTPVVSTEKKVEYVHQKKILRQKETGAESVAMVTIIRVSFCSFCDGHLWCQVLRTLLQYFRGYFLFSILPFLVANLMTSSLIYFA